MHPYFYILSIFILLSCKNSTDNLAEDNSEAKVQTVPISETKINGIQSDSLFTINLKTQLINAYKENNNYSFWIDNNQLSNDAKTAIELFQNACFYGLDSSLYLNIEWKEYISKTQLSAEESEKLDVELSKSFLLFTHHLNKGILPQSYQNLNYNPTFKDTIDFDYSPIFKGVILDNFWNLVGFNSKQPEYNTLQTSLENYCKTHFISKEFVDVPLAKSDSLKSYQMAKKALILHKYLKEEDDETKIMEALMKFQADNDLTPDGKIGKYTAKMLSRSTYDIWLQAAVNLQKWRWENQWPSTVFYANIPSYTLKVYENNEIIQTHRTVTGAPYTSTPTLDSKLQHFIINPEWYVPYSITSGELIPKMKKDSTYLERNGYSIVSKSGVTIKDIDWTNASTTNFKYSIKQGKGSGNALGRVKFIFNNKHSVYFHDTPSKSFFEKDVRAFSHGCVRIQNPFDLVDYIVKREQYNHLTKDSVQNIVKAGNQKTIKLKQEYPIKIRYYTSAGDSLGNLKTYIDIYQKDVQLKEILEQYLFGEKTEQK